MSKRKFLILFAVLAIIALFAATEVPAQVRPGTCVGGAYTVTTAAEFPRFVTVSDEVCKNERNDWVGGIAWQYTLTCDTARDCAKINKLHVYVPSVPDQYIEVLAPHVGDRGEGGLSTCIGDYILNGVMVSVPPVEGGSDTEATFAFCTTDVSTFGLVSLTISTGKSGLISCAGVNDDLVPIMDDQGSVGIVGPGFDISDFVPSSDVQIDVPDDPDNPGVDEYVTAKKDGNGCIKEFRKRNGDLIPWTQGKPFWVNQDNDHVDCGGLENKKCRGCFVNVKDGSFYYWDPILSRYVCYWGC